jgi:hypothetical protein
MMEKLAQAGEGGGMHAHALHSIYHHVQSCSVRSSWEGLIYPPYFISIPMYSLGLGNSSGGGGEGRGKETVSPTLSKLRRKCHHHRMYARKWPSPVYMYSLVCGLITVLVCLTGKGKRSSCTSLPWDHGLNMELDLQSFIWAPVYSWTHWLRPRNSPPPPAFWLIYEVAIGQPRKTISLCNPLLMTKLWRRPCLVVFLILTLWMWVMNSPTGLRQNNDNDLAL